MGITTDNATNNDTFIHSLAYWMQEQDIFFDEIEKHYRCFAHVINLSVHKALKKLDNKLKQVYIIVLFYIYIFRY
jgi:hypothetical protein